MVKKGENINFQFKISVLYVCYIYITCWYDDGNLLWLEKKIKPKMKIYLDIYGYNPMDEYHLFSTDTIYLLTKSVDK